MGETSRPLTPVPPEGQGRGGGPAAGGRSGHGGDGPEQSGSRRHPAWTRPPGAEPPGPTLGFHGRIPTCRSSPSPSHLCCPGGAERRRRLSTAQRCARRPPPRRPPPRSRAGSRPRPRGARLPAGTLGRISSGCASRLGEAQGSSAARPGAQRHGDTRQREPDTHVALGRTHREQSCAEKPVPRAEQRLSAPRSLEGCCLCRVLPASWHCSPTS